MSTDVLLEGLEDLDAVGTGPQRRLAGPVVPARILDLLCADIDDESVLTQGVVRDELVEAGWLTTAGLPSPRLQELRRDLAVSRVSLRLDATSARGRRRGWICAGPRLAVVALEEDALPSSADPARAARGAMTFEVVPVSALPIVFARWGGLAPTWNYDAAHELSDPAALEARVADDGAPLPSDADDTLRSLWSRPWTRWSIRWPERSLDVEYLAVAGAGQYVVRRAASGATALAPRPGSLVWGDLQQLVAQLPGQAPVEEDDAPDW